MSLADAARELDVSPATLRRWAADGLVPLPDGEWTRSSLAHARIVQRLRARGHSMDAIREASRSGRLAYGFMEDLFPPRSPTATLEEAAEECGLEPALVERIWSAVGFSVPAIGEITEEDLELLRYIAAALQAGFPLVAFLQLVRVYGQALARIADAEVKLFHVYVHEPLIHEGVDNLEMAEEMQGLARELLPLASPIMDRVHQRFVEAVGNTLPDDARIIKTIGDEVMIVASDAASLLDWAVGFQALHRERPLPRIGIHQGLTLYRDGDYYGREVNLAARVGARAAGGEVLVTRPLVDVAGRHLEFEHIGEVKLKGFSQSTELFLACRAEEDEAS